MVVLWSEFLQFLTFFLYKLLYLQIIALLYTIRFILSLFVMSLCTDILHDILQFKAQQDFYFYFFIFYFLGYLKWDFYFQSGIALIYEVLCYTKNALVQRHATLYDALAQHNATLHDTRNGHACATYLIEIRTGILYRPELLVIPLHMHRNLLPSFQSSPMFQFQFLLSSAE